MKFDKSETKILVKNLGAKSEGGPFGALKFNETKIEKLFLAGYLILIF